MLATRFTSLIAIMVMISSLAYASDPDPLQDFCVGVNDSKASVFVNGMICKDPKTVTGDDFFFSGLNRPGNITSPVGSKLTQVFVDKMPGLNTLGISLVRIDYEPNGGLNPPHVHPRASEIIVVMEGTLYAGFVTTNSKDPNIRNKLFARILYPGDVYVFPRGLIHFQMNVGETKAVAFASLNSQYPGVITLANSLFGSGPPIDPRVLARGFQFDNTVVRDLQSRLWMQN
ncbi:hypothetical protein BUALT_Bualt11G0050400 [Buddleja alternifolia]|uniref:Germin-like protein n=1 Tax=Buddleja alternifolia TaxID=168488 RepID=A0AAV6WT08_9LAMI|nr:hypothetical protein BUALT_Bualt11G0050400 [Buddleja alternifolia]